MALMRVNLSSCMALALLLVGMATHGALAAPPVVAVDSNSPVEVSADGSLEWYQDKRLYVARGGAKAVRGDTVVEADLLTAHQRETPHNDADKDHGRKADPTAAGGGAIDVVTAEGHVRIKDPRQEITGDKAIYDLDRHVARMTGNALSYVTARDSVTARDALEYDETRCIATARGRAVAIHEGRRIEADVLTVEMARGPNGAMQAERMTADGNVVVTGTGDVARGDRADYDVKKDVAVLSGHVRITKGTTQLAGDRAEVDFAKGQSRLLSGGKGRVKALLGGGADATPKKGTQP